MWERKMSIEHEDRRAQGRPQMPDLIQQVLDRLFDSFAESITLDDLADLVGISKFDLCRRFRREFGVTPMRWLWLFRIMLASEFIARDPGWSLTDIAFHTGFSSSAHFSRLFTRIFNMTPSQYRAWHLERLAEQARKDGRRYQQVFVDNRAIVVTAAVRALQHNRTVVN
jgi:AraC-like DNA-binding protein